MFWSLGASVDGQYLSTDNDLRLGILGVNQVWVYRTDVFDYVWISECPVIIAGNEELSGMKLVM